MIKNTIQHYIYQNRPATKQYTITQNHLKIIIKNYHEQLKNENKYKKKLHPKSIQKTIEHYNQIIQDETTTENTEQ